MPCATGLWPGCGGRGLILGNDVGGIDEGSRKPFAVLRTAMKCSFPARVSLLSGVTFPARGRVPCGRTCRQLDENHTRSSRTKCRHSESSALTWSGWARKLQWFVEALTVGKTAEDMATG